MAGGKWAHKIQMGDETTAGTAVAASFIWRGDGPMLSDDREVTRVEERVGIATPTLRSYVGKLAGSLPMAATPATFEQLPYLLEAGIKSETPAQDGAGSGYIYQYEVPYGSVNTIRTYTIEAGDNQQAEEMEYAFCEQITLSAEPGAAVMMSANWQGRQVANTTFTAALTPPTVEEILGGKGTFYIDDAGGTIGSTAITDTLLDWTLTIDTGRKFKYTLDSGQLYGDFEYFDKDSFNAELSLTFEHNATAVAEKTDWRNEVLKLLRLTVIGSTLTTAGTTYTEKTLNIDMVAQYMTWEPLGERDGNSIYSLTAVAGYDSVNEATTNPLDIKVVNELTALP